MYQRPREMQVGLGWMVQNRAFLAFPCTIFNANDYWFFFFELENSTTGWISLNCDLFTLKENSILLHVTLYVLLHRSYCILKNYEIKTCWLKVPVQLLKNRQVLYFTLTIILIKIYISYLGSETRVVGKEQFSMQFARHITNPQICQIVLIHI